METKAWTIKQMVSKLVKMLIAKPSKKRGGLGVLEGKIHYDDNVWGFYGA